MWRSVKNEDNSRAGFSAVGTTMKKNGTPWTNEEIEIIVSDYLDMLKTELSGVSYNKALRNRKLQEKIGRSKGSIEYKHQNISAVLEKLGLPFILGYKPASNYQSKLYEVIDEQLSSNRIAEQLANQVSDKPIPQAGLIYVSPPAKQPLIKTPGRNAARVIRFYDPATRDARARELGKAGERFLFQAEQNRLSSLGRDDLAGKVRWVSRDDGDGAGYDILSWSRNGEVRMLEVKTTNGPVTTPFWISRNELNVSERNRDKFRLARLFHFSRMPEAYKLRPPLADLVHLDATEYLASFR